MMLDFKKLAFVLALLLCFSAKAYSQGSPDYKGGLKVVLDEDGDKYFRLINWHQFWIQSFNNNPGTANVRGEKQDRSFDIGLRRSRFLMYSQINKKFLILMHWGINNQSNLNGGGSGTGDGFGGYGAGKKPQLFLHDAWTDYNIVRTSDFEMNIGVGLHYWNALSRITNTSSMNLVTLDAPIYNWPNIELSDQFARQYGIFVKGKAKKFGYRAFVNKPFTSTTIPAVTSVASNTATDNLAVGGYFEYQFKDQEGYLLPYKVGTYLGTKTVMNIGAGFYHHADASAILKNGNVELQDHSHFAIDFYLDRPLNKELGNALNIYSALFVYDFGDNYLRSAGILNTGQGPYNGFDGTPSISGYGNKEVMMGTGSMFYYQMGYLLPGAPTDNVRFQPFFAISHKQLDALEDSIQKYDMGINFFLSGHQAKFTLQYSLRPVVVNKNGKNVYDQHLGGWLFQTQIAI